MNAITKFIEETLGTEEVIKLANEFWQNHDVRDSDYHIALQEALFVLAIDRLKHKTWLAACKAQKEKDANLVWELDAKITGICHVDPDKIEFGDNAIMPE